MKKLIICLLAVVCCFSVKAQIPDSTKKKTFAAVDIYHGVEAKSGLFYGADLGYYLKMHLRKRLYLFTDYAIGLAGVDEPSQYWDYTLYSDISFAFRLNGEDKQWQYFPYVGTSISIAQYSGDYNINITDTNVIVSPNARVLDIGIGLSLNLGFEALCRLKNNRHIAFGVEVNPSQFACAFIRYGWNKSYKHK